MTGLCIDPVSYWLGGAGFLITGAALVAAVYEWRAHRR